MNLLEINNLNVNFNLPNNTVRAVRNLSLSLKKGETLGLVGESGCGKTITAYSILNLIKSPGKIESGEIFYKNNDLTSLTEKQLQKIRGNEISMIFQEPMTSLNPVFKIGYQISETIRLHLKINKTDAKNLAIKLLNEVGIPNASHRYNSYPHELSGGMKQRVMIAIALSANPNILIADEPTTALDVTIQAQILDLLLKIQKKRSMSLLFISHDLGVVANIASRIAIMYAGEIIEHGTVENIFNNAKHPYTKGLIAAVPKIGVETKRLSTIPGSVPTITTQANYCVFHSRCANENRDCVNNKIDFEEVETGHFVKCINL